MGGLEGRRESGEETEAFRVRPPAFTGHLELRVTDWKAALASPHRLGADADAVSDGRTHSLTSPSKALGLSQEVFDFQPAGRPLTHACRWP